MRGFKRNPWLTSLGVLLGALALSVGQARADVVTDQPGSVVIFPKVISDGTRDTLIQLANTSNMQAYAHCFYLTATGRCSVTDTQACTIDTDCPLPEVCARQCTVTDFDLTLTAQQPTMWRASTGRFASMDPACRVGLPCGCTPIVLGDGTTFECPGFESGPQGTRWNPLPVGTDFVGELKCIQVDSEGDAPFPANSLKGEALIENLVDGQKSEYNSLNLVGNNAIGGNNFDGDLLLNWPGTGAGEFNFCPARLAFTTYAEGAVDAFTGATVSTELTLIPCTELLESGSVTPVGINIDAVNEFEQLVSRDGINFDCYFSRRLADIPEIGSTAFLSSTSGAQLLNINIRPSSSSRCLTGSNRGLPCTTDMDCGTGIQLSNGGISLGCRPASGILGVAEEFHTLGAETATAAVNAHVIGSRSGVGDIIVLPLP